MRICKNCGGHMDLIIGGMWYCPACGKSERWGK